jgi:hypothetical protein
MPQPNEALKPHARRGRFNRQIGIRRRALSGST